MIWNIPLSLKNKDAEVGNIGAHSGKCQKDYIARAKAGFREGPKRRLWK